MPLGDLMAAVAGDADVLVLSIFREGQRESMPAMYTTLHAGDVLLVEADSESLRTFIELADAELVEAARRDDEKGEQDAEALNLREVIITAESPLVGRTVTALDLRRRHGINVVAVARQGGQLRETVKGTRFAVGDILLVQGIERAMGAACSELGCLPLADRGLRLGQPRRVVLALGLFAGALTLAALNVLPATTALVGGALAMVLTGIIAPAEAYRGIDLSIIVLLAAMIPVGEALETSGGAHLIAEALGGVAGSTSLAGMTTLLLVATMLLSNVVNNAAAAILVAPIAIDLAASIGASADPFLMAVAVGASAAFLTPIGHQSNTLVMAPGGYRFGDYWRFGVPLSIGVAAIAIPLILRFWPP